MATTKTKAEIADAARARLALAREIRKAQLQAEVKDKLKARVDSDGIEGMIHHESIKVDEWTVDMGEGPIMAGDAQHVVLFSATDGVGSRVRVEQMVNKLMARTPEGNVIWTEKPADPTWKYAEDEKTGVPVRLGRVMFKCRLAPDAPDREWLDEIGLGGIECAKYNMPSMFQLRQHMQVKHKGAWAAIQEAETRQRADEERAERRQLMEMMAKR